MRVVAGTARGRRLVAPPGAGVRPTSDRVREATFNALTSLGALDGAKVLDLFAGSGALAIEALSRGAAQATLVEAHRVARAAIETNLATTGLADRARTVALDALTHLRTDPAPCDLVLCDPPYAYEGWEELLAAVTLRLGAGGLVVIESNRPVEPGPDWRILRAKGYGDTVVTIARLSARAPHHPGASE